jgi:hypothetical protein
VAQPGLPVRRLGSLLRQLLDFAETQPEGLGALDEADTMQRVLAVDAIASFGSAGGLQ